MMKYPTNNENTLVQKTKKVINVCKKPAWNLWLLLISYQHLYMRATATRYNFKKITIVCKWKNKLIWKRNLGNLSKLKTYFALYLQVIWSKCYGSYHFNKKVSQELWWMKTITEEMSNYSSWLGDFSWSEIGDVSNQKYVHLSFQFINYWMSSILQFMVWFSDKLKNIYSHTKK